MKIQINGFDIEIITDDTTLTMKVLDASGKELSNNTFEQSDAQGAQEVQPADLKSAENSVQPDAQPEIEETEESLIPTLESLKKLK